MRPMYGMLWEQSRGLTQSLWGDGSAKVGIKPNLSEEVIKGEKVWENKCTWEKRQTKVNSGLSGVYWADREKFQVWDGTSTWMLSLPFSPDFLVLVLCSSPLSLALWRINWSLLSVCETCGPRLYYGIPLLVDGYALTRCSAETSVGCPHTVIIAFSSPIPNTLPDTAVGTK